MGRMIIGAVAVGASVALLTACGGGGGPEGRPASARASLDDRGDEACNLFAIYEANGDIPSGRAGIAIRVSVEASHSTSGAIATRAAALLKVSDSGWTMAADSFAAECLRLGWSADDAG